MGASGASAAVAVIVLKERQIVEAFRRAGATTAAAAGSPDALGVPQHVIFHKLVRRAVLREARPGFFYLDEPSWNVLRRIRRRFAVALVLLITAVGLAIWLWQSVVVATQLPPVRVTLAQFRQLQWLAGQWRGSGGAYPSFFEEYRFVNDSTIRMRALSDSTFRVTTDSSMIEWRNGTVTSRGGSTSLAVELTASSVKFMKPGATSGGFTWKRDSADQWTTVLHPSTPRGRETVYVMRRVGR